VSAPRTSGWLVRLYPPAWRARYGEELEALIVASSDGRRVTWRVRADVALGAVRERLRAAGLTGDGPAPTRVRGGALLTLCAWALFTVAGLAVQKFSEHWQDATPADSRALPSAAFAALVIAAVCGSLLVLAGIGSAMPSLAAFLRAGGWPTIRRRVVIAAVVTGAAIAATVALVVWAHALTGRERDGHDLAYAIAFVAWALLIVATLFSWTAAAVAAAGRLRLPAATLRIASRLAGGAAVAMAAMTAATAVWWASLADAAPWFLAGRPVGSNASPVAPELAVAATLMLLATLLGGAGAYRAARALPGLAERQ
jgi:hypothetical protein